MCEGDEMGKKCDDDVMEDEWKVMDGGGVDVGDDCVREDGDGVVLDDGDDVDVGVCVVGYWSGVCVDGGVVVWEWICECVVVDGVLVWGDCCE